MRGRWLCIVFALVALGATSAQEKKGVAPWFTERVTTTTYDGLIVSASFEQQYAKGAADEYWQPTKEDVAAFERGLLAYLKNQPLPHLSKILLRLSDYKRHYRGIMAKHKKVLMVSFFFRENSVVTSGNWEQSVVAVCGGGDQFFRIKYDIQNVTYYDFWVNAPL